MGTLNKQNKRVPVKRIEQNENEIFSQQKENEKEYNIFYMLCQGDNKIEK